MLNAFNLILQCIFHHDFVSKNKITTTFIENFAVNLLLVEIIMPTPFVGLKFGQSQRKRAI